MKNIDINLLPEATRFELQKIELEKKIKKLAFIAVIVWLVVLGLVVGARLFLKFRLSELDSRRKQFSNSISDFSVQIGLQRSLRFRLKLVSDVLDNRSLFYGQLNRLNQYFPESFQLSKMDLKRGRLELSASVASLEDLNSLEDKLKELNKKHEYDQFNLTGLGRGEYGRWNFNLEVKGWN